MSKELFFEQRQAEIAEIVQGVKLGERDALIEYANIKRLETEVIAVRKELEEYAMTEAEKYAEKSFEVHGLRFEKRSGARRWDFKGIPEWDDTKENLASIEAKYKAAWESAQSGTIQVTPDGEQLPLPKVLYNKDSLIIKEPKR